MNSSKASDDPHTASPSRPPKINVKVRRLDDGRQWNFGWFELYASRRQIDWLIAERPFKWIDDNKLVIADLVEVTTDAPPTGLSEIMEHEFTPRQMQWTPHSLDMRNLIMIWMDAEPRPTPYYEHTPGENAQDRDARKTAAKVHRLQAKAERTAKAERPQRAPKPDGLIDLATLLADTDISPKEARNALRKMKADKPAHGWSWPKDDAEAIKPKIIKKVKELRK